MSILKIALSVHIIIDSYALLTKATYMPWKRYDMQYTYKWLWMQVLLNIKPVEGLFLIYVSYPRTFCSVRNFQISGWMDRYASLFH